MVAPIISPDEGHNNPPAAVQQPSASDPTTAAAAVASNTNAKNTFSSMGQLQKEHPKLYNMILQGIAVHICSEMKKHQDKIKELNRKARQDANG